MRSNDEDPLTLAMMPPPDEAPEQRLIREAAEAEAKRISNEIDEQIRRDREQMKKMKKPMKLLLLGQSESGKTATLKNFQLTYARKEWSEERTSWRPVIFLNLIRNVNTVLFHLSNEMFDIPFDPEGSHEDLDSPPPARTLARIKFTDKHRQLRESLEPLDAIQHRLEDKLGSASLELHSTSFSTAAPFDPLDSSYRRGLTEFSINSSNGWKSALDRIRNIRHSPSSRTPRGSGVPESPATLLKDDLEEETASILASVRKDMKSLWEDNIVKEVLTRRKVRLEDGPGFFLSDLERIADRNYQPTDDDVIRARLRTLGVQEYRFIFDQGRTMGQEWRLYDVGGTRNNRAAWYPYFDDVDAIIFLAPISPFDEKLAEDRHVNRLEDSFLLWRALCSCKILEKTHIILFLNKCDLLQAKLQRGLRIRDSVPSYGDRKNEFTTAVKYFQHHFKEISKSYSPSERPFYVHFTSVIDTRSTAVTLGTVEEIILREHLRKANLM